MVRHFELRDLPTLHRYRGQGVYLDSERSLTWGATLIPINAVLSSLSPSASVFTPVCQDAENPDAPLLGQIVHPHGSPCAHLNFLAPESAIDSAAMAELLDALVFWMGERGAQSLLAEVDEGSVVFEVLRKSGFSVYCRQRIWKFSNLSGSNAGHTPWHAFMPGDEHAIKKLYNSLVPGLVQQVEPLPWGKLSGQVYYQDGEVFGFVTITRGPNGIWLQPFFHPEIEEVSSQLYDLVKNLTRLTRPIYIVVRSYQTWLEYTLESVGAEPGQNQAVMVRRTAVVKPALRHANIPALEGAAKTTTPIVRPQAVPGRNGRTIVTYDEKTNHG
jgi:hypothetical protein